jgi:hypothetical protein
VNYYLLTQNIFHHQRLGTLLALRGAVDDFGSIFMMNKEMNRNSGAAARLLPLLPFGRLLDACHSSHTQEFGAQNEGLVPHSSPPAQMAGYHDHRPSRHWIGACR